MTNLDRLDGTDLLIHGFADFVRSWYQKLEENGMVPTGFIDPTASYTAPGPIPADLQVFYDLIAQGYRLDIEESVFDFDDMEIISEPIESISSEATIVRFGRSTYDLGVFGDGNGNYRFIQKKDGVWSLQDETLSHYLITVGLESLFATYPAITGIRAGADILAGTFRRRANRELRGAEREAADAREDLRTAQNEKKQQENAELETTIIEASQPIWTLSEIRRKSSYYWHPDGFMLRKFTKFSELAFTDPAQMNEWQGKTGWEEKEQKLKARSETDLIKRFIDGDKRLLTPENPDFQESDRNDHKSYFERQGISFPKGASISVNAMSGVAYATNTRANISAIRNYLRNARAKLNGE